MKVAQVMHKNPVCVGINETLSNIAKQMKKGDFGVVIVKDKEKCLGMITDRDIVTRAVANDHDLSHFKAKDVMSKKVVCCKGNDSVEKACSKMKSEKIRRLVVTDDKEHCIGILSLGDIAVSEKEESGYVFETLEKISEPGK